MAMPRDRKPIVPIINPNSTERRGPVRAIILPEKYAAIAARIKNGSTAKPILVTEYCLTLLKYNGSKNSWPYAPQLIMKPVAIEHENALDLKKFRGNMGYFACFSVAIKSVKLTNVKTKA
ncbi:MAG: hypothetical protein Tsb005_14140 [Gammaproteobacteria bacterium]